MTPRSQYAQGLSASDSTRQSTVSYDRTSELPKLNAPSSHSRRPRDLHEGQRSDPPAKPPSSTRPKSLIPQEYPGSLSPGKSRLIRRVTAVVEIPVKEEIEDDDFVDLTPVAPIAASESSAEMAILAKKGKRKMAPTTAVRPKRKSHVIQNTPESSDEHSELDAKSHNSDDEDELMIGQEVRYLLMVAELLLTDRTFLG